MERDERDNSNYKEQLFFFTSEKGNLNLGLKFDCSIWECEFESKLNLALVVRGLALVAGDPFCTLFACS